MNTAVIIAHGIENSYTTAAASICAGLSLGDKTDWFLPSRNELIALAQIRGQFEIPNEGLFWSSSQATDSSAYIVYFTTGNSTTQDKTLNTRLTRAVRAF